MMEWALYHMARAVFLRTGNNYRSTQIGGHALSQGNLEQKDGIHGLLQGGRNNKIYGQS